MKEKKIAIITGGASGMGLATAIKLHEESNYLVIAADLKFGADFPSFLDPVVCDVGDEEQVKKLFQYCKDTYKELHLLVSFAGVHSSAKVREASVQEFEFVCKTNMLGIFLCSREALRLMETGSIINIASSVGTAADRDAPFYSASKAWVIQFTKCLALKYGEKVRCNTVSPGPIDTKFLRKAFNYDDHAIEAITQMNPCGRIGQPEEVANLIKYLASDEASFINGSDFPIDGGERINYFEPEK